MTDTSKAASPDTSVVRIEGVRLSFPSLDKKRPNAEGSDKTSYQATFLFPPNFDFTKLYAAVKAAMMKGFGKLLEGKSLVRPIIRNAEEKEYAGYDKGWKFIASKSDVAVPIVGPDKTPIALEDITTRVYAGCYVNAVVEPWCQDNKHGKAINWNLKAIQFVKDGERLDGRGKPSDPDKVFEALELPPEEGGSDAGTADKNWSPW